MTAHPVFALLVCGSRAVDDGALVFGNLDFLTSRVSLDHGILAIEGGAGGAGTLAGEWARSRGHSLEVFPADWETRGNRATLAR